MLIFIDHAKKSSSKNAPKKRSTKVGGSKKTGHVTPVMKGGGKPPALSRSHTTITPRRPPSPNSRLPNIRPGMPSRSNTVASITLAKPKGQGDHVICAVM